MYMTYGFKTKILDLNNKGNVLDWSIQWILQILVLKHNDRFFPQIISSTYLRSNSICLRFLLNCIKIKYVTNSFGSGIVVVFAAVTIICIGTTWWPYQYVSVGVCIDTVPIQTYRPMFPWWYMCWSLSCFKIHIGTNQTLISS